MPPRAVFFDLAGTLIRVRGGIGAQYALIAREFGVSRERARQIEAKLTARLREYLRDEIPDFELLGPPGE